MSRFRRPILIVEDDPDIADACRELLEDEGYPVDVVGTGVEAISYLEGATRPCLVLLDLRLPDLEGNELLEAVERRAGSNLPIVVATALTTRASLGHRVLHKPYDLDELLKIAREYGCEPEGHAAAL